MNKILEIFAYLCGIAAIITINLSLYRDNCLGTCFLEPNILIRFFEYYVSISALFIYIGIIVERLQNG